ncbi:MAG: tetratricopeptide repeat protein [Anaerolineae bacterium]|nr:tetratricopeptide repeat protein [Anaerolineae bacterium]
MPIVRLMIVPHPSFTQIAELIQQRLGIGFAMVQHTGSRAVLENLAKGDWAGLYQTLLKSPENSPIWQQIIHEFAIGETFFLREHRHYKILREHVLPQLIRHKNQTQQQSLRIWCAGCSTGEEAYSLAITLLETVPDLASWQIRILATDINEESIQRSRTGQYRDWSFRQVPPGFKERYFTENDGPYQIKPQVQEMVSFQRRNLLEGASLLQCDLITCRNVMMYFGKEQKAIVEDVLYSALAPGGWLFLGQAEAIQGQRERWITHIFPGAPIYQKPADTTRLRDTIQHQMLSPTQPFTKAHSELPDLYALAVEAVHEERFAEAEQILSQILAEQPQHARGHTLLASLFANQQAYPEAGAHLDTALRHDPMLADAHYLRGPIALEQDQLELATEALRRARYCHPGHMLAAFTLGMVYTQVGESEKATITWQGVLEQTYKTRPTALICDVSNISVGKLQRLLEARLGSWQDSHPHQKP